MAGIKRMVLPVDQDPQRKLSDKVGEILAVGLLQGHQIVGIVVGATTLLKVKHGLGRKYLGWFSTNGVVCTEELSNPDKNTELWLVPAIPVDTLNLWVF